MITVKELNEQEKAGLVVRLEEALNEEVGNEPKEYHKRLMKLLNNIKKKGQSFIEELMEIEGGTLPAEKKKSIDTLAKNSFTKVSSKKVEALDIPPKDEGINITEVKKQEAQVQEVKKKYDKVKVQEDIGISNFISEESSLLEKLDDMKNQLQQSLYELLKEEQDFIESTYLPSVEIVDSYLAFSSEIDPKGSRMASESFSFIRQSEPRFSLSPITTPGDFEALKLIYQKKEEDLYECNLKLEGLEKEFAYCKLEI